MTLDFPRWIRLALVAVLALMLAGCGDDATTAADDTGADSVQTTDPAAADQEGGDPAGDTDGSAATDEPGADETSPMPNDIGDFPREVETAAGPVSIEAQPTRIVSLSATATEILYAVGAGDQVVAVDLFSNYPPEAPEPSIDAFNIDLESIVAAEPDLVISVGLPEEITAGLAELGIPSLVQPAAVDLNGVYEQIAQTGEATGHFDEAAAVNAKLAADIQAVLAGLPEVEEPVRVFHEIDDSFYTATTNSFIGQVYAEMGFENIADAHDPDGFGYPLIDGETIIAENPNLIVFTDQAPYTAADIAARPGWDTIDAVANGNIVSVDADIASRWGPRIVDFMTVIADAVAQPATTGS